MRLVTGAMRSANRSPSASSTTSVAGRRRQAGGVRAGTRWSEAVIPSPLLSFGARRKPTSADARLLGSRDGGLACGGRRAAHGRPYAGGSGDARLHDVGGRRADELRRLRGIGPLAPGLVTAPSTVATSAASASASGTRPARSSALPAWTSAMSIDRCHAGGTSARKSPAACPRSMSGSSVPEHGAVAVVELLVRLGAGVDGDERVVAARACATSPRRPARARPRGRRARARPRR